MWLSHRCMVQASWRNERIGVVFRSYKHNRIIKTPYNSAKERNCQGAFFMGGYITAQRTAQRQSWEWDKG